MQIQDVLITAAGSIICLLILIYPKRFWRGVMQVIHTAEADMQQAYSEFLHEIETTPALDYDRTLDEIDYFRREHCKYVHEDIVMLYVNRLYKALDEAEIAYSCV